MSNLALLATNIQRRMRQQGLTEAALAKAAGVAPRTIRNFLRPDQRKTEHGSGTISNLFKIAMGLNIEPNLLLRRPEVADFHVAVESAYTERRAAEPPPHHRAQPRQNQ